MGDDVVCRILVTSHEFERDRTRSFAKGVVLALNKPFSHSKVVGAALSRICSGKTLIIPLCGASSTIIVVDDGRSINCSTG